MQPSELREQVDLELDRLDRVVVELQKLLEDVRGNTPSTRERVAAGAFLADFYMAVERILERISRYHGLEIDRSERWHTELFQRFCSPAESPIPVLFPDHLAVEMRPYRRFRHVVHHGYGFDLDWDRMEEGIRRAPEVRDLFSEQVRRYLDELPRS